jgi:hypothetical protein
MNEHLPIALTFDAENDYFDTSIRFAQEGSAPPLSWRGIEEVIPAIRTALREVRDDLGRPGRATWFIRVDGQLEGLCSDAAHLLTRYRDQWLRYWDEGDEIAFHPHLYTWDGARWGQATAPEELEQETTKALAAMRRCGFDPVSSRIGEAFCSNVVLSALEANGIRCDSTAMPGRERKDGDRLIDWRNTPQLPYRPARSDYRVPGPDARALLEVPMSMIETRAEYDTQPLRRYIDLSFHNRAIRAGLADYLATAELVVCVTHPSALVAGLAAQRHGLLSFDFDEFRRNLECLITECRRLQRPFRFITMGECWNLFTERVV